MRIRLSVSYSFSPSFEPSTLLSLRALSIPLLSLRALPPPPVIASHPSPSCHCERTSRSNPIPLSEPAKAGFASVAATSSRRNGPSSTKSHPRPPSVDPFHIRCPHLPHRNVSPPSPIIARPPPPPVIASVLREAIPSPSQSLRRQALHPLLRLPVAETDHHLPNPIPALHPLIRFISVVPTSPITM